jgi:hypothetical protein
MSEIGGNMKATIQISKPAENAICEDVLEWQDAATLTGFLDLSDGDSRYNNYSAKVQESTHVFISKYVKLPDDVKEENSRMMIDGLVYDVKLIDDPMHLHQHLEIYLSFTGGVSNG